MTTSTTWPGATTEPELIADEACETGEGPLWHATERRLYWVDIPPGRLFRYNPATGTHEKVHDDGDAIGGYTIQEDGGLLLFGANGSVRSWRDGTLTTIISSLPDEQGGRFNDVIADPEGRVFCGTMPIGERPGRLYRLDPDGSLTTVLADAGLSNGLGFAPDLKALYHADSTNGTIRRYPYDRATGDLGAGTLIVQIPAVEGVPDGLAVDASGGIWSARWDGGALVHYGPDGVERGRVVFPARKVSSVTFAGPELADAYVTTAGGGDKTAEGAGAGALFRVRLGVRGQPGYRSRIGLS